MYSNVERPGMPRELGTVQYDTARAPQPPDSPALGVGEAVIDPPPASSNCSRLGNGSLHPDSGSTSSGYMVFSFSRSRLQVGILFVWGHPDPGGKPLCHALAGSYPEDAGFADHEITRIEVRCRIVRVKDLERDLLPEAW